MTISKLQRAVDDYIKREPKWMRKGNDPMALMKNVAGEHGLTYAELRNAILDHFTTLGAG